MSLRSSNMRNLSYLVLIPRYFFYFVLFAYEVPLRGELLTFENAYFYTIVSQEATTEIWSFNNYFNYSKAVIL